MIRKIVLPIAAVTSLLLMIAWMAGLFGDKVQPGLQRIETTGLDDAITVQRRTVTVIEPVPASVEAKHATLVSSRILAGITAIHVRAGDSIEMGQLILELENTDLLAKAEQAGEQIRATEARLTEARQNLERARELDQKKLIARSSLDAAQADHDSLVAEHSAAQQALHEAQTAVGFSQIRSPIAGRVVDRFAEPGDTATPGTKLLYIYDPLSLRIEAPVREHLALSLANGQSLEVEIPALDRTMTAQLEELVPAAEPGSRSFLVKARVPFDQDLSPGMYARLLVPAGSNEKLVIPADRVFQVGQLNLVWVLQDGHANQRFGRVGSKISAHEIIILTGLEAGEQILRAAPN